MRRSQQRSRGGGAEARRGRGASGGGSLCRRRTSWSSSSKPSAPTGMRTSTELDTAPAPSEPETMRGQAARGEGTERHAPRPPVRWAVALPVLDECPRVPLLGHGRAVEHERFGDGQQHKERRKPHGLQTPQDEGAGPPGPNWAGGGPKQIRPSTVPNLDPFGPRRTQFGTDERRADEPGRTGPHTVGRTGPDGLGRCGPKWAARCHTYHAHAHTPCRSSSEYTSRARAHMSPRALSRCPQGQGRCPPPTPSRSRAPGHPSTLG